MAVPSLWLRDSCSRSILIPEALWEVACCLVLEQWNPVESCRGVRMHAGEGKLWRLTQRWAPGEAMQGPASAMPSPIPYLPQHTREFFRRRQGRGDSFEDEDDNDEYEADELDDDEKDDEGADGTLAPLRSDKAHAASRVNGDRSISPPVGQKMRTAAAKVAEVEGALSTRGWYSFPLVDLAPPLTHEELATPYAPGSVGFGVGVASVGVFDRGMRGAGFTLGAMAVPSSGGAGTSESGGLFYPLQDTRGAVLPVSAGNGDLPLPSRAFPKNRPGTPQLLVAGYLSGTALLVGASHVARVLEAVTAQVLTASCGAEVIAGRKAAAEELFGLLQSAHRAAATPGQPPGGKDGGKDAAGGDGRDLRRGVSRRSISGWDASDEGGHYALQLFPADQRGISWAATQIKRLHGGFVHRLPDLHVSRIAWLLALHSTAASASVLASMQVALHNAGMSAECPEARHSAGSPVNPQIPAEVNGSHVDGSSPAVASDSPSRIVTAPLPRSSRRLSLPNAMAGRVLSGSLPPPPSFIVEGRMKPDRSSQSPPQRPVAQLDAVPAPAILAPLALPQPPESHPHVPGLLDMLTHPLGTTASPGFLRTAMRSLHAHVLVQPGSHSTAGVLVSVPAAAGAASERIMRKSASVEASLNTLSVAPAPSSSPLAPARTTAFPPRVTEAVAHARGSAVSESIQKLVAVFSQPPTPAPTRQGALPSTPQSRAATLVKEASRVSVLPLPDASPSGVPQPSAASSTAIDDGDPGVRISRAAPLAPAPVQPSGISKMLQKAASEGRGMGRQPPLQAAASVVPPSPLPSAMPPSTPKSSSYVGDVIGYFSRARANSRAPGGLAPIGEEIVPQLSSGGAATATPRRNLLGIDNELGVAVTSDKPGLAAPMGGVIAGAISAASVTSLGLLITSGITHVLDDDRAADWIEGELDDRGDPLVLRGMTRSSSPDNVAVVAGDRALTSSRLAAGGRSGPKSDGGAAQLMCLVAAMQRACSMLMPESLYNRRVDGDELLVPPAGLLSEFDQFKNRGHSSAPWPAFTCSVGTPREAAETLLPSYDRSAPSTSSRPSARPFLSHFVRCQVRKKQHSDLGAEWDPCIAVGSLSVVPSSFVYAAPRCSAARSSNWRPACTCDVVICRCPSDQGASRCWGCDSGVSRA